MRTPDPSPDDFRFWIVEHIRFADLDLLGHVNNKAFLTYAESVRAAFLHEIGLWTPSGAQQNVLVQVAIDYRRELHYPGEVRVGLRIESIGRSSFSMTIGLFDGADCAASVSATLVRIDVQTRRPQALDEATRLVLEPYR
jgi:acyl-CoA thioester hydrolase